MGEVGRLVNRVIGVQRTFSFDDILGTSSVMEKTKELARIAAGTSSNILIQGETGTGKEVFAQAIHNASAFNEGPFLAVNCAALPRDLIESELFGYVEGAFTGASKKGRLGKFELASGGTIFLDEIGEVPPEVQVKLLRVLQEKTIVRVGGDRTIPIDCRLIAATNRDLHSEVSEQRFRRDLLYRLNVITIEVPPLRERQDDIPLFIERFLHTFAERNGKIVSDVSADVVGELSRYSWPGNVRELENVIEHAVALVKDRIITREDLPLHLRQVMEMEDPEEESQSAFDRARKGYEEAVRHLYLEALRVEGGDVVRAAKMLGVSRATLYRRLKEHGLLGEVLVLRLSSQN
jgi:sigma-54 dependent transcriptional regulator, acetoin dehydrogenase operon transcriptional activator AcoR